MFTVFPDLPAELRIMIWERAVEPRKITYYLTQDSWIGPMRTTTKDDYTPIIFHINQESRRVAEEMYHMYPVGLRYEEFQAADGSTKRRPLCPVYIYICPTLDIWMSWRHGYDKPMQTTVSLSTAQHMALSPWNLKTLLSGPTCKQMKLPKDLKRITIVWNAPEELSSEERTPIQLLWEEEGNWSMPDLGRKMDEWRAMFRAHKKRYPDWYEPELSCARVMFANDPNNEAELPAGWRVEVFTKEMEGLMI